MSTPLYKRMKEKGTSFYAFPSASHDINLTNYNDDYRMNFTKFMLLNIPKQSGDIMNLLPKSNAGSSPFYSTDPNYNSPTKFSEQLIESLRNYIANYDTTIHESRINQNTDFYNIGERFTPTEHIFWKWCRKLNLIDLEPCVHKVDWDKNISDFSNPNANTTTNVDYFKKYLWKEREIIEYNCEITQDAGNVPKLTINEKAKFKSGDKIYLKGDTGTLLSSITYTIVSVDIVDDTTELILDESDYTDSNTYECIVYLNYHKLVQYIGEVNQISNIQTATKTGQEVTAYIPHHVGSTPSILFGTRSTTNYYPNLEVPILSSEIQEEIIGSESLNSPIRTTPSNYPGSYFGYFDTNDKTYLCTDGDKLRLQGDYYGIIIPNNVGLNQETYFEKLEDFNSNNIDGVYVDFNRDHYYKMSIPGLEVNNFDEFNSIAIENQPPSDFEFNAILWYYELTETDDEGNNYSYINLYGIEFLNNPEDGEDKNIITPYKKLVTNGEQDGLSYMFNLNIHYNLDNDIMPLRYDSSTIYSMFGFDLYNEMMKKYYRLNENFVNIIQEFVRINLELQKMKSVVYSQIDIDELRSKMNNMEQLLTLYQTNQFADSDTAKITIDNSDIYPRLKFNVVGVEYDEIYNVKTTDIYNYNFSNQGKSYPLKLSFTNKMLLNIINDNLVTDSGNVILVLDGDLRYKQKMDIFIKPDFSLYYQKLFLNMNFDFNNTISEVNLFNVNLPKDLISYNVNDPNDSIFDKSYYLNENVFTNTTDVVTGVTWCETGFTNIVLTEDLFNSGDTIFVQNLYLIDASGITKDYSGSYKILDKNGIDITIDLKAYGYKSISQPIVSYYKGIQISILRIDETNTSNLNERYDIKYKVI